jgi:hypothetical protein
MRFFKFILLLLSATIFAQNNHKYDTFFEKGNGNQSANYLETMNYYKLLDKDFKSIHMQEMGLTDSGEPLHIIIFNAENEFNFKTLSKNKTIILINNGIHAGEPDGIDATMQLYRDLALGKLKAPKDVVIVAIPIYNIGGALNRNSTTRVNQDGPEEYGFRGNARNFDLNRDFIKSDTRNTRSFIEIFHLIQPAIFIDNHVSNGADYQYTLTYIMTEPKRLGNALGDFVKNEMTPSIVADLKQKKIECTPYVNVWNGTPAEGFAQFSDSPRYATGYTSLFNTIGYVVETHMLKKYSKRVKATYDFMNVVIHYAEKNRDKIKKIQVLNETQYQPKSTYAIQWSIDSSKVEKLSFLGYEGNFKKSDATNGNRLFYDKSKPYTRDIPFFGTYKPIKEVIIPEAYLIPKGFWPVVDLLKSNHLTFSQLKNDTIIEVESYQIVDFKTAKNAYEGHYPHTATKVSVTKTKVAFIKGDYVFSTRQKGIKFLLETLEPEAIDSYFNWNFFDTILQQKEGYSDYVFEDLAAEYLRKDASLRELLEQKKKEDPLFEKNSGAQLDWIYKNSVHYEKAYLQYPVYRIME